MGCFDITNWCSAAVSIGEQLPEDGLVRLKHVAVDCGFTGILKWRRDCERFWGALWMEMSEQVIHQCNRMLKYNIVDRYVRPNKCIYATFLCDHILPYPYEFL
jgi:hypothetical protein